MLADVFSKKKKLDFHEFKLIIIDKESDMFLCLFLVLRQGLPTYELACSEDLSDGEPSVLVKTCSISSPKHLSSFKPISQIVRAASPNRVKSKFGQEACKTLMSQRTLSLIPDELPFGIPNHKIRYCFYQPNNIKLIDSPNYIVKRSSIYYNGSCQEINITNQKISKIEKQDSLPEIITIVDNNLPIYSGYLYVDHEGLKLKKFWLKLTGRTLFQYNDQTDNLHFKVFDISGCFVHKCIDEEINTYKLFSFNLSFFKSVYKFYALDKQERDQWIDHINHSLNHRSLDEFYTQGEIIGKGAFGEVRLGYDKRKGNVVAIKSIYKYKIQSTSSLLSIRREVDVLKMCQHPNIVQLYDFFENYSHIFIVMEYMK